jgi:hypothetical protein
MPKTHQAGNPADLHQPERTPHDEVIGGQVLRALGRPSALHRVQVRQLWEGHYRVNVLVGADAASARVAHSYFLVAGEDGTILASTPKILRRYEPVHEGTTPDGAPKT